MGVVTSEFFRGFNSYFAVFASFLGCYGVVSSVDACCVAPQRVFSRTIFRGAHQLYKVVTDYIPSAELVSIHALIKLLTVFPPEAALAILKVVVYAHLCIPVLLSHFQAGGAGCLGVGLPVSCELV